MWLIKTNFLGDEMPNKNIHYTNVHCIAYMTIDSVMKMKKMNYPQFI